MDFELLDFLFGLGVDFGDDGDNVDFLGDDAHVFNVDRFEPVDD